MKSFPEEQPSLRVVYIKKLPLKLSQNSQENTCATVPLFEWSCSVKAGNFIKKETLVRVFSCEFCEISKNNFLQDHLWTTASRHLKNDIYSEVRRWFLFKLLHQLLRCFAVAPYLEIFGNLCSSSSWKNIFLISIKQIKISVKKF